jgi:hypothetical protein
MSKTLTLTPAVLRKIVLEEKRKLVREAKMKKEADAPLATAEEVDADEYADTLEAHADHTPKNEARRRYQALNLQERRLMAQLQQIRENKRNIRARLLRR